jgi:hypothetical protein
LVGCLWWWHVLFSGSVFVLMHLCVLVCCLGFFFLFCPACMIMWVAARCAVCSEHRVVFVYSSVGPRMVWILQKCDGFAFLFRGATLERTKTSRAGAGREAQKTYFTMARGRVGGGGRSNPHSKHTCVGTARAVYVMRVYCIAHACFGAAPVVGFPRVPARGRRWRSGRRWLPPLRMTPTAFATPFRAGCSCAPALAALLSLGAS